MTDFYEKIGKHYYLAHYLEDGRHIKLVSEEVIKQKILEVLPLVVEKHPGAFMYGCGRRTMVHCFEDVSGIYFPKSLLRSVIKENCKNSYQNAIRYWMFEF